MTRRIRPAGKALAGGGFVAVLALGLVALGVGFGTREATPARAQGGQVCIQIFPPPPGCEQAAEPLSVSPDREQYAPGAEIAATVTNRTAETAYGGGGYDCGVVQLEVWTGSAWERAPGGAEICPAIAVGVRAGEMRVERFAAPVTTGWYRLVVDLSGDSGARLSATSPYFPVY